MDHGGEFWQNVVHWRMECKSLQYCLENTMKSMKRQKDRTMLDDLTFLDLIFQVPLQYCSLQHWTFPPSPVTSTTRRCFCFGSVSILSGVIYPLISSSILGTYLHRQFTFQCPIFLPFHTVHGVLKARILKWFSIPFSTGPRFVRILHHNPSILGGPTQHGS